MDLSFFRGETVIILRTTYTNTENAYGQYENTIEEIEAEAVIGVVASNINRNMSNVVRNTTLNLIFNYGTEIYPDDKFILRGTVWEKADNALTADVSFAGHDDFLLPPVKVEVKQVAGNVGQTPNSNEAVTHIPYKGEKYESNI